MKSIPLTGKFSHLSMLVSDEDYSKLRKHRWHGIDTQSGVYARTRFQQKHVYAHRMILGLQHGDPLLCDHRNHKTLDNRRSNLRVCTQAENGWNRKPSKLNTSGVTGVGWSRRSKSWRVVVTGKHIGMRKDFADAVRLRNKAAREIQGEFAYIYPIPGTPEAFKQRMKEVQEVVSSASSDKQRIQRAFNKLNPVRIVPDLEGNNLNTLQAMSILSSAGIPSQIVTGSYA